MKTVPAALATHLAGDRWTLATLWLVTRTDSTIFRFTDHDEDILFSGNTYKSAVGYDPTAIKHGIDASVDNMEVRGVIDDLGVKDVDLMAGLFDHASVLISIVNWASPSDGSVEVFKLYR